MSKQMTPLRQRMIEDMAIRNMSPSTQKIYVRAVANFSIFHGRSPDWVLLVVGGLVAGNGLLDILERQKQLLGIELLRSPAELRTLQLARQSM